MLKKIVMGAVFAAGLTATPQIALADDACMLTAGCFWVSGPGPSDPGRWVCPDPNIYMMCADPPGIIEAPTLDQMKALEARFDSPELDQA